MDAAGYCRTELDKMETKGAEESERAKLQREVEERTEMEVKEASKCLKLLSSELKLLQATLPPSTAPLPRTTCTRARLKLDSVVTLIHKLFLAGALRVCAGLCAADAVHIPVQRPETPVGGGRAARDADATRR